MSDVNYLSQSAQKNILVAQALEINQDNIYHYFRFLDNLKFFQAKYLPRHPRLCEFFNDLSIYQLIHEKNYLGNPAVANPLLILMQDLSALADVIPKDVNDCLHEAGSLALLHAIRLTGRTIAVIPTDTMTTATVEFQEKIAAISDAVKAATAVIQNPFNVNHRAQLYLRADYMRTYQEGKVAKDAHDNPKNNRFVAALEVIAGIALMAFSSLMAMAVPILGFVNLLNASHCVYRGTQRLVMIEKPWVYHSPLEQHAAKQSVDTGRAMVGLANYAATLFHGRKAASVAKPKAVEIELMSSKPWLSA